MATPVLDDCRMGKPVTDEIFNEKNSANYGLQLRRGPDPRYNPLSCISCFTTLIFCLISSSSSYNAPIAAICRQARAMLQLDQ